MKPQRILLGLALWTAANCGFAATGGSPNPEIDQQIERASKLFEEGHAADARKIYESLLPGLRNRAPSQQLGFVLNTMSKIAAAAGNYSDAIQFAKQSADVYHQINDAGGESHALNNKAIAEIQNGAYPEAQRDLAQALALSRSGRDTENEVQVLNNLGSAYYFPGSYSEALKNYDDAMSVVDQNASAKWSDYWRQITNVNRATLFQRLGRFEKALQIYRQVEQSSKELTPNDRAHLDANLGALYRRLGDPYKALDTYRIAQQLYSGQRDSDGEIGALKNIGIVYALDMEDLKRARTIFRTALVLAQNTHNRREEMQAHLYLGETLFRAHSLSAARAEFDRSRALANELGTTEEQWKSIYGLGRIEELSGNADAAEANYRQAIFIIEKSRSQLQLSALRSEFFADKREAYDALIGLLLQKNNVREAFLFLERSRARSFQDRYQQQSRGSGNKSLTLEQAQSALDPSAVLFEFWTSKDRIGLIWCSRSASGMMLKRLPAAQQAQIVELLNSLPNAIGKNWRDQISVLSALLPESSILPPGIRHLLVVPDGWISYVPFDLLQAAPTSNALLIERYDITYLPTAALLLRPQTADNPVRFPWTRELVAFGDPLFKAEGSEVIEGDMERDGTQRLRYSAAEIADIKNLTSGATQLFLQENDLKRLFLGVESNSAFLLHVSTHAFADVDNPENSRMLFSSEIRDSTADYVFLRELYELDLSQVSLATISACDTERGKIIRGEGMQAFSRALLSAGSSSSLTALWRVDDEPTAEFMKQFYFFALKEHRPKAQALQLAKLKFLHSNTQLADPRLWAAFVLNGDGLTPLPAVISWGKLTLAAAILVLALLCVGLSLRLRSRRRQYGQHDS